MDKDWYTYKEIIEMFGICKQTLNNWRRNGTIIYKKFNQRTFLYQLPENKSIQENEPSKNL
jgi:predicted site-specific integrase-resolvase